MEGWSKKSLSDLAHYINGYGFKPTDWQSEGLPIIRIEQLKDYESVVDFYNKPISDIYIIDNDDLIFSWSASLFLKIWKNGKAILNQHLFKVIPFDNTDKFFLKYRIEGSLDRLINEAHGSTMKHITRKTLNNFIVKLPDELGEQQKIASILSTIDKNIELTEQLIAKQKNIKTGLMHDLLSYGIDEKGQIRSPQTHNFVEKNGIVVPEEWEVNTIESVFDIYSGSTPSTSILEYWNGTLNWITPNDLNKVRHIYINESERKITKSGLKSCSTTLLPKHTIVLSSRAPIGYLAITTNDFCTNQGCKSFIFKDKHKHVTEFFLFILSFYMNKIKELGTGTTFQEVSKTDLLSVKIPFPKEKGEQQQIVDIILKQDQIISEQEIKLEKLKSIKKGLMEDLLTGKVRVNY